MNRYLPKDTCEYLVSLGCESESGEHYNQLGTICDCSFKNLTTDPPAFDLMDILMRANAEKIWPGDDEDVRLVEAWETKSLEAVQLYQTHPDTWTDEVSKLIKPTTVARIARQEDE